MTCSWSLSLLEYWVSASFNPRIATHFVCFVFWKCLHVIAAVQAILTCKLYMCTNVGCTNDSTAIKKIHIKMSFHKLVLIQRWPQAQVLKAEIGVCKTIVSSFNQTPLHQRILSIVLFCRHKGKRNHRFSPQRQGLAHTNSVQSWLWWSPNAAIDFP